MATAFAPGSEYGWHLNHSAFPCLQLNETIKAPAQAPKVQRLDSAASLRQNASVRCSRRYRHEESNTLEQVHQTARPAQTSVFRASPIFEHPDGLQASHCNGSWVIFLRSVFEQPHPLQDGLKHGLQRASDVAVLTCPRASRPATDAPVSSLRIVAKPRRPAYSLLNATPFASSVGSMTRSTNFVRLIG